MTIRQHTVDTPYMVGPVHFYTTEIDGELILIDTGPPTDRAKKYLQENVDLQRLKYIFITHCHIDHYGLAHWLEEQTDAQIFLPYRDGLKIISHNERLQDMYGLLNDLGFSGDYLEKLHLSLSDGKIFPSAPEKFKLVEDDMPMHLGIQYHSCPGHSQSDLVYYNDEWAVTGDTLLRGVFQSPLLDVDLETGERFSNYRAYCTTLVRLASLRQKLICPGHRKKVESVDTALVFYISRMLDRAAQLQRFADENNIAAIITELFGKELTEPFLIYLKASEILFMQDFLAQPQNLKATLETIGLFETVAERYEHAVSR
jgi:glyoxylase-like metal-dependent hydrolase (beta-lactamase superfamily II)